MDLADLRSGVAGKIGLDNNAATEQPYIDKWVNQARDRVLMDTGCYVTAESLAVSSLTQVSSLSGAIVDYTIPTEALEIVDLYIVSSASSIPNVAVDRVSVPDLIEKRRISLPTGSPSQFYALGGANLLMFWPLPASTDVIELYYIPVPTDLSSDTHDPSTTTYGGIPKQLHKAIEFWACAEAADEDDDQSSAQGERYRQLYMAELTRYHKFLRKRGGIRNQRAVVNDTRRRPRRFHSNDVYYSGGA